MTCKECGEEADELVSVTVGNKKRRVCEDCADRLRESEEVNEQAEGAMQSMMEYKGRR